MSAQFDSLKYKILLISTRVCMWVWECRLSTHLDRPIRAMRRTHIRTLLTFNCPSYQCCCKCRIPSCLLQTPDHFGRLRLFLVATILYNGNHHSITGDPSHNVCSRIGFLYNCGYVGTNLLLTLILLVFLLEVRECLPVRLILAISSIPWISGNIITAANPQKNWSWNIAMWAFVYPLLPCQLSSYSL
ncbi:CNT_HP2_G0004890.mRNA.1.CDS.1 [Saccharomyces cerevisiae]|nr:CNT_HP2_G0004890.mRNA.1.CDS.1 [Saccharomyces cerevisiae]CAI6407173.1 CNT_HP2_G0004890.mRNA.1.CDS.1 [Saccharomyces cerevisiae]